MNGEWRNWAGDQVCTPSEIASPGTTEDLIEVAMDEPELQLLRLLDGKRSLYEVCTSGPFSPAGMKSARLREYRRVGGSYRRQTAPGGQGQALPLHRCREVLHCRERL